MKTNMLGQLIIDEFRGDYWFLSNFYPSSFQMPMSFDGEIHYMSFPTSEHAYQAYKAKKLSDAQAIVATRTPADAKKMGATVTVYEDWDNLKVHVMENVVFAKFTQNDKLRQRLIDTGDAQLIEGNTWNDKFWGVCDGEGKNHLGIILMRVREWLQQALDKESSPE